MAFETKEEVLEKIMGMEKPACPHCNARMSIWEVPSINVGDGLGWGTPYLFMCFNDECSLYTQGWDNMMENYAHHASYRCMNYPGTDQYELMPVFSPVGATGQVIDEQVLAEEEVLKQNIKFGNQRLQEQVDATVKKIHERFYTRECPFCAEIIKNRAKVCKHCGKEVAGL